MEEKKLSVISALCEVKKIIEPIKKKTQEERGIKNATIKYAYIGIDDICDEVQNLFGKHGVVCVPMAHLEEAQISKIVRNGNDWTHIILPVTYNIFGTDGNFITAYVIGEAMDNSDKGMNKAQTSAYKNLLLRLLDIGDSKDDTDNSPLPESKAAYITGTEIEKLNEWCAATNRTEKQVCVACKVESFDKMTVADYNKAVSALKKIKDGAR